MLKFRKADIEDVELFYNWANDPLVRNNSYQKEKIIFKDHQKWFSNQINDDSNYFYVFLNGDNLPIGQVRINIINEDTAIIGLMVDAKFRGKGFAKKMIEQASEDFLSYNSTFTILAYVFKINESSFKSFINANYKLLKEEIVKEIPSFVLYKKNDEKRY